MGNQELNNLKLEEEAKFIVNEGVYISRVEFHQLEISLYRINGEPVEIWFEPCIESITKISYLRGNQFNPYLKHLNTNNMN